MSTPAQAILQDLQNRLGDLMRSGPAADVERNVKAVVNQAFQKLDLVTRDELDAYAQALSGLKDRVAALEARLAAAEASAADAATAEAAAAATPAAEAAAPRRGDSGSERTEARP